MLTLLASQSGSFPYLATAYAPRGAVPSGQSVVSADDASLRASVLSRWSDGSASVVVVAGETALVGGSPRAITLQAGPSSGTALTAARVGELVTNVTVSCGAVGSASISSFGTPERVWWANAQVICCRYRAPVGSDATLEAVVDIHAFASGRAFVEVTVENGKVNAAAPAKPASKTYTATVSVNGVQIGSAGAGPNGTHEAFRAWYASGWVGGDPGVEVTHDTASMQAHPIFFRCWKTAPSMSEYASDSYVAWQLGRNTATMGATGDDATIGPMPLWDVQYLQSGAKEARRAVLAQALGQLAYPINYRSSTTGKVVTYSELAGRSESVGTWPTTGTTPDWKCSHHPAGGLMAFLCRPSPVFIELAQKIATKTASSASIQIRGRAWATRSQAHSVFVTPDGDAHKAAARSQLVAMISLLESNYSLDPNNKLNIAYDYSKDDVQDIWDAQPGTQNPVWEHQYLAVELHKADKAEVLSGTDSARMTALADWALTREIRYVNEASGGSWRLCDYVITISRALQTIDQPATWGALHDWAVANTNNTLALAATGPWTTKGGTQNYANSGGAYYDAYHWAAFAMAVERGLPGAETAWTTVNNGITGPYTLATWSNKFVSEPRWGVYPRNK